MIRIFEDLDSLSQGAADLFAVEAVRSVQARGLFTVALSGGTTPRRTYKLLASTRFGAQVPWAQVHVFWGDERCVPQDDPRSNARMAREALLDHVPLLPRKVHPVHGEDDPARAARLYEKDLREHFGGGPPRFDLIFLGLGRDGHTASLFPGTAVLEERRRWAAEVYDAQSGLYRVTLTLPVINQARIVCFLVSGQDKADVLAGATHTPTGQAALPAQRVNPLEGELLWYVDRPAAARLKGSGSEENP